MGTRLPLVVPLTLALGGCAELFDAWTDSGLDEIDDELRQDCVDTINAYRATVGLDPLGRALDMESCADEQAASDAQSGEPHGAFGSCGESAQNECPGYSGLDAILDSCLAQMWAEGPGDSFEEHGHYLNMTDTSYTEVACGFHVEGPGEVWAVQNFY